MPLPESGKSLRIQLPGHRELIWRIPRRQGAGDSLHHVVQERFPSIRLRQLLRNSPDMTQSRTDIGDEPEQFVFCCVHWREIKRGLPCMFDRSANASEQQCTAGDGLHPGTRLGGSAIPTPPVVHERDGPGAGLAALNVLGRKAPPSPLILQLVKAILTVSSVPIELRESVQRVAALPQTA